MYFCETDKITNLFHWENITTVFGNGKKEIFFF